MPAEKALGARERTNSKLNPHVASTPGFESRGECFHHCATVACFLSSSFLVLRVEKTNALRRTVALDLYVLSESSPLSNNSRFNLLSNLTTYKTEGKDSVPAPP